MIIKKVIASIVLLLVLIILMIMPFYYGWPNHFDIALCLSAFTMMLSCLWISSLIVYYEDSRESLSRGISSLYVTCITFLCTLISFLITLCVLCFVTILFGAATQIIYKGELLPELIFIMFFPISYVCIANIFKETND